MEKFSLVKFVHWSLLFFIIFYIISGFGISEYRIIEGITLGLLSKPLSFQIHLYLIYPLVILIILHVFLTFKKI